MARHLVLSAVAEGPTRLKNALRSRDSELMLTALSALGAEFDSADSEATLVVQPMLRAAVPEVSPRLLPIECGLAGTVMRFLPPVAVLRGGRYRFDGDPYARCRPLRGLLDALRQLGVSVHGDALPFTLESPGAPDISAGQVDVDASASSQFVSGLLLVAASFPCGLRIQHRGPLPSKPHVDMTVATIRERGVRVRVTEPHEHRRQNRIWAWEVSPGPVAGGEYAVEPDLSNAAPFVLAPLLTGSALQIRDWPPQTTQPGAELLRLLTLLGGSYERVGTDIRCRGGERLRGLELNLAHAGELAPNLIGVAALASEPSRFTGLGHIRGHETDRLAALETELRRLGARIRTGEDWLELEPAPLHAPLNGGVWHTYADHRMATTGALLGLRIPGIRVEDIACTAKTFPKFPLVWEEIWGKEHRRQQ